GMLRIKVYEKDIPSYSSFHSDLWDGCLDWHIPLGEDKEGEVYLDVSKGHIVIAGATTFGKSQMIKLLISS
ncbi:hypothetical protein ACKC5Q_23635, partial [Aeromonas dhakensis]|uniref:hypothetical protein n=1 Tax=Aeromonas dhakensis TaxID=196024 RepID=UPI0038B44792